MQEKKHLHGGYRQGSGRKPLAGKAMQAMITARVSAQEKKTYQNLGGARWLRSTLEKTSLESNTSLNFIPVKTLKAANVPLAQYSIQAGFPSPAEDYIERTIDFNELLIKNEPATFVVRASGQSMIDASIDDGDLLIVDRSREPKNQDIVIMQVNNEFTVKRLVKENGQLYLKAENSSGQYPNIYPKEVDYWICFGVVSFVIKSF